MRRGHPRLPRKTEDCLLAAAKWYIANEKKKIFSTEEVVDTVSQAIANVYCSRRPAAAAQV